MKTIRRKAMKMAFEPTSSDHTFTVSTGNQRLGYVTYLQSGGSISVTNLQIEPYLEGLGIESQILDALLSHEDVEQIQILSPLSLISYYEEAGFECPTKQILLTKKKL